MKISRLKIKNFRLLKELTLDLQDTLSLVIGKNNCGKTSLLALMNKFLNEKSSSANFYADDFNIDFQNHLRALVNEDLTYTDEPLGISLKLFIEYEDSDNLANLSSLIMDLDPANKTVVLFFEYTLRSESYHKLKADFKIFEAEKSLKISADMKAQVDAKKLTEKEAADKQEKKLKNLFFAFFRKYYHEYFLLSKKTLFFDVDTQKEDEANFIDLAKNNIKLDKIINFKVINARRDVSNKDADKTLSGLSSKYYETKQSNAKDSPAIVQFKDTIEQTDEHLDGVYPFLFEDVIDTVRQFGGIRPGESVIKIVSTLQDRELLKGNTTVMYDHFEQHALPEHYNGLGYMNLIGMIFEIEVLLSDLRRENKLNELPADLNILFIEEPEAHTHPQMQYVFIKNIKRILEKAKKGSKDRIPIPLQTIITTHSSHITAESDFDDLKYFTKIADNEVIAKNIKDLKDTYLGDNARYDFLKQYLTINRTELFFADKVVLIEGDTERLLLSAIMKKLDHEYKDDQVTSLLSQNISVVEVGAHSQIFEKLITFLNLKTLIITDIDTYKLEPALDKKTGQPKLRKGTTEVIYNQKKCPVESADGYGNNAIHLFTNGIDFSKLLTLKFGETVCRLNNGVWELASDGNVYLAFQMSEGSYHARSYEDAFIALNLKFIKDNLEKFPSLKNVDDIDDYGPYEIAENCIGKKTGFALDILYASDETYSNWSVPAYIKEGLLWLKK